MNSDRIVLLIMIFVLPLWLTIGRAMFGSIGWFIFVYLFVVGPILLILLLTDLLLRIKTAWTTFDTISHYLLYACIFLHGLFIVDFGDNEGSLVSVFSRLFGDAFIDVSGMLSFLFLVLSLGLLITVLIRAVIAQIVAARNRAKPPVVAK